MLAGNGVADLRGAGTGNPDENDGPRWSNPPGCLCICPGRLRLKAQAHAFRHVTSPGSRASSAGASAVVVYHASLFEAEPISVHEAMGKIN